jgi:hypothetical protein
VRAAIVTLAIACAPQAAAADRFGPAIDLTIGVATFPGQADGAIDDRGTLRTELAGGVQRGRFAALVHGEQFFVQPADPVVDSGLLTSWGLGATARLDLRRGPGVLAQLGLGVTRRWLRGDHEVLRTCSYHGGCEDGFYLVTPVYHTLSPSVALTLGYRPPGEIWPLFGIEVGASPLVIDRPGRAPDSSGAMVWAALHLGVGSSR